MWCKYSLSERLIRTIAAICSFPHDNVEDLIRGGADVNCTHFTLKPLHCACMVSDADCVELLLEKGAEVNALDGYNRTALHYATEKDEACVEVLLEYESGASVNALDYNNDTPLSWAAMKGKCVSILLNYGAEVRVTNLKGQKPISCLVALLVRGIGTEKEDSCFELLHRAVGHFELRKNGTMPSEVTKDQQLCEKLTLLCSAPGTLNTLACYAVRHSLGLQYLPDAVKGLPLPASLKESLLLLE
ncbi:ankyrin repeat and SOCS box protein 8 [Sigmodon hispidus]